MTSCQQHPLKLYIQDVFRAKQTLENKYIYEIFGLKFKNVMIHGVVTAVSNRTTKSLNLEISDPTGSVNVVYNTTVNQQNISDFNVRELVRGFADTSRAGDPNIIIMSNLLDRIIKKKQNILNFNEGSYVSVVGDICIDDVRNIRTLSAFQCKITSAEYDLIWLEELRYLYDKFYLWIKE